MTDWNPFEDREAGLPPSEVRLLEVRVEPRPAEERRVRVHLQVSPFEQRPNIDVMVLKDGLQVASISIIEAIETRMSFTMHIRGVESAEGSYTLAANLSYPDIGTVDQKDIAFETQ